MAESRFAAFGGFAEAVLSDGKTGSPSSTRVALMFLGTFNIVCLGAIVHHMLHVTDITALAMWLGSFAMIVGVLSGLMVLPYTIGKGLNVASSVASSIAQAKANGAASGATGAPASATAVVNVNSGEQIS